DDTVLVPESNENNNCKASTNTVTVSAPDLTETSVTDRPATIGVGSSFSVSDTVQNKGSSAAAASTTRYYLSTTGLKSGARLLTGNRAVPSLTAGTTSTCTVTVTVTTSTTLCPYTTLFRSDDTVLVPESNENNNCKASTNTVTVSASDLTETSV